MALPRDLPDTRLTDVIQTSLNSFSGPSYARNYRASCSFRTLLQTFPSLQTDTCLCNKPRHISWSNTPSRPLHIHTSRCHMHIRRSNRGELFLPLSGKGWNTDRSNTSRSTNERGNCFLLHSHQSSQILTTPSANTFFLVASARRTNHHCV